MCIGAKGDNLSTEFSIAADNLRAWIRYAESIFVPASVDFKANVFFNQRTQNLINNFLVFLIGLIGILIRTVANNIV